MPLVFAPRFQSSSPSTRRAWIEIYPAFIHRDFLRVALHPEGVDRNMVERSPCDKVIGVALHPEGVDRNLGALTPLPAQRGRPPPGGRG